MESPRWMKAVLLAAAACNLAYAAAAGLFPGWMLAAQGVSTDAVGRVLWQSLGLLVGLLGLGYAAAALDPLRHWPIVLVGFLGKLFAPLGFAATALQGILPWRPKSPQFQRAGHQTSGGNPRLFGFALLPKRSPP